MAARRARLASLSRHQADADRASAALAAIIYAVQELRSLDAPTDWLAPCILDGAADVRGRLDRLADDDGETIDWRPLDAALEHLQDRPAGKLVQLRLL